MITRTDTSTDGNLNSPSLVIACSTGDLNDPLAIFDSSLRILQSLYGGPKSIIVSPAYFDAVHRDNYLDSADTAFAAGDFYDKAVNPDVVFKELGNPQPLSRTPSLRRPLRLDTKESAGWRPN